MGLDPSSHQRRAPLRLARLAAVDARSQPLLGGRLRADPPLRQPLAGQACAARAHLGLLAPCLRRHPPPVPGPGQRHRPEDRAPDERDGVRGQPRVHRLPRLEAVVSRVVTGAGYGLTDWLAQRITATIMAVYSIIALVVILSGLPITYAVWKDLFSQGWMRVATLVCMASLAWRSWRVAPGS